MTPTSNTPAEPGPAPSMPYIDGMLKHIAEGDSEADVIWDRHLHWGYWEDPSKADGTPADYAAAAERLTGLVLDAAKISDGMRVIAAELKNGLLSIDLDRPESERLVRKINISVKD